MAGAINAVNAKQAHNNQPFKNNPKVVFLSSYLLFTDRPVAYLVYCRTPLGDISKLSLYESSVWFKSIVVRYRV